jgi:hypothetical protein
MPCAYCRRLLLSEKDAVMSECLHCAINSLITEHIKDAPAPVDMAELAAISRLGIARATTDMRRADIAASR